MNLTRTLVILLIAAFTLPSLAGGKKRNMPGIAFHVQTQHEDNPKMIFQQNISGRQFFFRRMPDITSKDIQSFKPFPAKNGEGYGAMFQLKPGAKNRLSALSAANLEKWLLARVNGRAVDAVIIDNQINDGILVIWKRMTLEEIQGLDKSIPRTGEKKPRG